MPAAAADLDLLTRAAAPLRTRIAELATDQLGAPTPCPDYDLRGLLNHLLFWAPSLAGAASKEPMPPPAEQEVDVDLVTGDWRDRLTAAIDTTVAAWARPQAWEGSTSMTGAMDLPAPSVGGMQLCELVLHGWDVARATRADVWWDDDVLALLEEHLAEFAELGRSMDAFGPAVEVQADAPPLDRVLGLAGRDPAWPPGDLTR